MVLVFKGLVEDDQCGDDYHGPGCVKIAGRYPLHEADETFGSKPVTIAFADAEHPIWVTAEGALDVDPGMRGYSEWTPAELAELKAGGHDFTRELFEAYLGDRPVRLVISDQPVNVLDLPSS